MKIALVISMAILSAILFTSLFYEKEIKEDSDLIMQNIDALTTDDEEEPFYHCWCCGTTGTCFTVNGVGIAGKLQYEPCGK